MFEVVENVLGYRACFQELYKAEVSGRVVVQIGHIEAERFLVFPLRCTSIQSVCLRVGMV